VTATPDPADAAGPVRPGAAGVPGEAGMADELDVDDAFGHPSVPGGASDTAVWSDGDEDDIDV